MRLRQDSPIMCGSSAIIVLAFNDARSGTPRRAKKPSRMVRFLGKVRNGAIPSLSGDASGGISA